jgi:ABC-type branched-subunit amino acid transport system substrate-binding protein
LRNAIPLVCLVLVLLCSAPLAADDGVSRGQILLGQSCALTGPAQDLGRGMRAGLMAAFQQANKHGGVNGRTIKLITLDDGYEPDRAIVNTRKLINTDRVFLLIGEVGTPTSKAALPIAQKAGVPFFGPFTGAEFLRTPFKPLVINIRASYNQEMERLARYLVDEQGLSRIACFYQNDSYGRAGLRGIEEALARRDLKLAGTGTYERNTLAVKSGLLSIRRCNPQAVVMVGAYEPCAEFIKLAKKIGMGGAKFCNISFVGSKSLAEHLGPEGDGVVISQVVAYPFDESIPLVQDYTHAMETFQPEAERGFISLEGYMAGRTFIKAAAAAGPRLTRQGIIQALEDMGAVDLDGLVLRFGPQDHQGLDQVFLTVIRDGEVVPLEQ